jgi:hypothetical protein
MATRPPNKTIEFQIIWNEKRRSWDVQRQSVPTGSLAYDRSTGTKACQCVSVSSKEFGDRQPDAIRGIRR